MRIGIIALGVILTIIGVFVILLSVIVVPYTTTRLEEVPHSNVWLDETFSVPALTHKYYSGTFSTSLHITFTVTSGGNRDIDFQAMDEVNYWKMRAGESYNYYIIPTRTRITSLDIDWTPPSGTRIYFVFDNSFSLFTSKTVSVLFTKTWTEWENVQTTQNRTLIPSQFSYFGILIVLGGLALVGYGIVTKQFVPQPPTLQSQPRIEEFSSSKFADHFDRSI